MLLCGGFSEQLYERRRILRLLKKFTPLDYTVTAVCLILLSSFFITIASGIVNHGNIIGSIICVIVILNTVLYRLYKEYKPVRIIGGIIKGITAVMALYTAVISVLIISGALNSPPKAENVPVMSESEQEFTETVIVLGCKANNGHPSLMLKARLDKAAEYLTENPKAVCILTGGQGADEIEPEAVSMERYLLTKGIDKDRIYREESSRNTEENLLFSKSIIDEQNLPRKVIIISEAYHVYRGARNAEKLGLEAYSVPTLSESTLWALPSYWIREIFAVSRDFVYEII